MIVYLLTNKANGKYYVGQTMRSLEERLADHAYDARRKNGPLQAAIRKNGIDGFHAEILSTATTMEELNLLESLWILMAASTNRAIGYNANFGGFNRIPCSETREKLRLAHSGRKQSPETIAKRVAKLRGQKRTGAALENLKSGGKKRSATMSGEEKRRRSERFKGIPTGKAPANKGKKGVQVAWNKGIKATEEERQRLVAMRCRQVYTPERRAKTSATMKGRMPAVNLRRMAATEGK